MTVMAKVAQIVGRQEVAFNKGSVDGVEVGAIARLMRAVEVTDPDNQEVIGTVLRAVARFRISEVQDRLCVGESLDLVQLPPSTVVQFTPTLPVRRSVTNDPKKANSSTLYVRIGTRAAIDPPEEPASADKTVEAR